MAKTTIDLPQVGETTTEGTIQKWLKKPGDKVAKYDPLVEVETDKVTMEFPSPMNGTLGAILVEEGSTVQMGAPICEMETEEVFPTSQAPGSLSPAQQPLAVPLNEQSFRPSPSIVGGLIEQKGELFGLFGMGPAGGVATSTQEEPPVQNAEASTLPSADTATPSPRVNRNVRLSPVVQKLAAEHDVSFEELSRLNGSGLSGRVTKIDLLKYIERRSTVPASQIVESPQPEAKELRTNETRVPLSNIRRRIAENMTRALEIPVAWSLTEVDVTGMVKLRQQVKEEFKRQEGIDLTYLPFAVQAVVQAIKENPLLNSRWGNDHIALLHRINIGIAVAAAKGLVVPVIHNADQYSIAGLARAISEIVQRAREDKLRLEDIQGGTFTFNNTGALGTVASQPIINHPQVAILTTEAIVRRPVVIGEGIFIRSMMNVCLSFDHRVMDGNDAVSFLQDVKRRLEAIDDRTIIY
jgi:2-oxoisovalerate dehydrogenase E2 component (dihydrolipoyl transacylase)